MTCVKGASNTEMRGMIGMANWGMCGGGDNAERTGERVSSVPGLCEVHQSVTVVDANVEL